jgi:hypothetical protein
MITKIKEVFFLQGENKLMLEKVFLERATKPTSSLGYGIPTGVLLLTNRRLFFFKIGEGKSLRSRSTKYLLLALLAILQNMQ